MLYCRLARIERWRTTVALFEQTYPAGSHRRYQSAPLRHQSFGVSGNAETGYPPDSDFAKAVGRAGSDTRGRPVPDPATLQVSRARTSLPKKLFGLVHCAGGGGRVLFSNLKRLSGEGWAGVGTKGTLAPLPYDALFLSDAPTPFSSVLRSVRSGRWIFRFCGFSGGDLAARRSGRIGSRPWTIAISHQLSASLVRTALAILAIKRDTRLVDPSGATAQAAFRSSVFS